MRGEGHVRHTHELRIARCMHNDVFAVDEYVFRWSVKLGMRLLFRDVAKREVWGGDFIVAVLTIPSCIVQGRLPCLRRPLP